MATTEEAPAREAMEFDVVIVGAGPAGLAAAIRLKQLDENLSVVVLEKGSEVGAHILSGAVIDPIGLDRLIPDWRTDPETPLKTKVAKDQYLVLTATGGMALPNWPMPRLLGNHGNFVGSLGMVVRWLAKRAESLGVEIYPGFAASETLYGPKGEMVGVATGDMGVGRDGKPKPSFTRGHGAPRQVHASRRGRARIADQAHRRALQTGRGPRSAKIRNRHQGIVAGRSPAVSARPGAAHPRLAARAGRERRILSLSL